MGFVNERRPFADWIYSFPLVVFIITGGISPRSRLILKKLESLSSFLASLLSYSRPVLLLHSSQI